MLLSWKDLYSSRRNDLSMARRTRALVSLSSLIFAASFAACASDASDEAHLDTPLEGQTAAEAQGQAAPQAADLPAPPQGTATIPDARLANEVLMKLVADREVDARNFSVYVVNGEVTLSPEANTSEQEKQRALRLAQAVDGITNVVVQGLAPATPPPPVEVEEILEAAEEVADASPLADAPTPPSVPDDQPVPPVEQVIDPPATVATPEPPKEAAPAKPEAAAPDAAPEAVGENRPYTVRRGESLSVIASRQLGDGTRWNEIYRMNRDTIGPNPDGLREGMTIMLPPRR